MEHYLHKRSTAGNYHYCHIQHNGLEVTITKGSSVHDYKPKTVPYKSEQKALEVIDREIQTLVDKDYESSDLRIIDLFGVCFRDNAIINNLMKYLKRHGINDIRRLDDYGNDIQQSVLAFNGRMIKYLTNPSETLIKTAIEQNGSAIEYIDNPSKQHEKAAVQSNAMALKFIQSPTDEVIDIALESNEIGFAQAYIHNPSPETVIKLLEKGISLRDIKTGLKEDYDFAMQAIDVKPKSYNYLADHLKQDKSVAFFALRKQPELINEIERSLFKDKAFVSKVVNHNGMMLEYADDRLKADKEVVMIALAEDSNAIMFVAKPLKQDKAVKHVLASKIKQVKS